MQVNVPRAMGLRSQEGASIVDLTSTTPTIPKPARAEFILFRTENRTPRPSAPLGMARPISPQGSCYDCAPFNGVLCQMMKITSHVVCSRHDLPRRAGRNSGHAEYSRPVPKAPFRRHPDASWRSIPHLDSVRTQRVFRRTLAGLGSCSWKPDASRSQVDDAVRFLLPSLSCRCRAASLCRLRRC